MRAASRLCEPCRKAFVRFVQACAIRAGAGAPRLPAWHRAARSLWFIAVLPSMAFAGAANVRLQVGVRQQTGPVPYIYRAGVFLNSLPAGYALHMFFADQRPGMVELSWEYYRPLLSADSEAEFLARLPQSNLAQWVHRVSAAGGEPYIRLMPVPKWLWSGPNGWRKPPRDWRGWAQFVAGLVHYFNVQMHLDVRYVVWDEPDNFWQGTTADYLKLYKYAAAGLLTADPAAQIGGPAPSWFGAAIGKDSPQLLTAFVHYCAATPLPGLAPRLPLDFLVWHTFDAAPLFRGQYSIEARAARTLLQKSGYSKDVKLVIGSWTALGQYPDAGPDIRDTPFLGAFIVSSVIAMHHAGINRQAFFNLYEDWRHDPQQFSDDMGLTTKGYVAKAGFYAYGLLGRLQGRAVPVRVEDPYVQAAAARDGKTLRVIVSNFVPPPKMLEVLAVKRLEARGYSPNQLKAMAPDRQKLRAILMDRRRIETWNVPPDVRATALKLHGAIQLSARRRDVPVELNIGLNDLPKGRYSLREYRVDKDSGNPYEHRKTVERLVQEHEVKRVNAQFAPRPSDRQLVLKASGDYVLHIKLPPYAVALIEIRRAR